MLRYIIVEVMKLYTLRSAYISHSRYNQAATTWPYLTCPPIGGYPIKLFACEIFLVNPMRKILPKSKVSCAKLSLRKNYCFRQVSRKRKWGVQNCIIINMQNFVENPHMYCSICLWYSVYLYSTHFFSERIIYMQCIHIHSYEWYVYRRHMARR